MKQIVCFGTQIKYVFHNDQKPSILKLKNRRGERKEIVKAVDFKKFVPRYVCNIGCCTFSSYINSDFLSHLRLDHVHCDQFFCDLCAKNNDNGFVSSNPKIFVKHFNLHKINKYQCIFCLFGAECIEVIIIHLAMEHFEYEPLCLERSPKNDVCDKRKIKNLNILNIKKYVPDEIIEVVGTNLIKKISIKESLTKEMNDTRQMDPDDMFTNTKIDEVDNSAQLLNKIFKKIAQSSRNTSTAIDKKKNEVTLSDEVKQKVSQDTQQIQNVIAPIVNEKKKPSELSNDNLINNFEIQISGNSLETHSSEKPIDLSKKYVTKSAILNKLISIKTIDKVTQNIHSSENRLNYCPIESPKESTFSIAQSDTVWNSSYEADKLPKRLRLNRFTCTFCNLELPSSDIVKRHVRKEHNISNLEFVPVDINATDIEKDRFLVCQDKSSKTKKRSNDCIVLTDDYDSTTTVHKKRFKVDNKYNDSQLTALPNTLNTPEQHTGRSKVKSREKHKILKRKHSSDSCNNISNKKTSNPYMSNDTILGTTIEKYFSSENIDGIPETEYFLEPMRCLFCDYQTKVRSNLMAHIKKHRVEPKDSTENIFKSISCNSNSVFTSMNMISSFTSLFDVQQNEKIKLVNFRELKWHFNHHAENLYFCQYCSFIHFKREKIKAHMKRKHSSFIEGENEFNIIAIRKQKPIQNIIPLDQQISKWICKLCGYDVKYTKTGIAAHMSKIHNTLNTFKCSICLIDYSDYDVFKKHLKLNHPYSPVNYLNKHVDKVSSGKELQPLNKQTNVGEYDMRTQCNMLNVSETLNSVAESTIIIPGSKEISTTTCSKSAKSIVVSEVQKKILSNPSDYPNDYLTMIQCIAKYVCPVCNVFITEEEQSFCEHLLKEINCKLWKCLECFSISDSLEEMESHIIKHRLEKRKFEKIESFNKNSWVNRIIEHQNILIEYVLLRKFDQNTDFAIQNESKV
ncbi:uncharacterized protein LOC112591757 [Melanaphis sacchari]|uniref:uncharacterized protein LOC112591757 n=1 Tax=Melanaphis sacchari TaxID=742174 RepID=UPI000DC13AEF|nr:uncharacterized protein LOC112591757 [Melanaphis sacchari]